MVQYTNEVYIGRPKGAERDPCRGVPIRHSRSLLSQSPPLPTIQGRVSHDGSAGQFADLNPVFIPLFLPGPGIHASRSVRPATLGTPHSSARPPAPRLSPAVHTESKLGGGATVATGTAVHD